MLVPLTKGYFAIIDEADADAVGRRRWSALIAHRNVYAHRKESVGNGEEVHQSLHRFLWGLWGMPPTPEIDHENGNGLDCRRLNLRAATHADNMCNTRKPVNNTSGHKGVSWDRHREKWTAEIRGYGERRRLGRFDRIDDAIAARELAEEELHGRFRRAA
jgi:hypothetical protein